MTELNIYCPRCGKWADNYFKDYESVDIMPGTPNFDCPNCGQTFSINMEYYEHKNGEFNDAA